MSQLKAVAMPDSRQLTIEEAQEALKKARTVYNKTPSQPAGYRIKVMCIPAEKGLEEAEADKFETLREKG